MMSKVFSGWSNYRWLLLSVLVIVLDQWTKHLALAHLLPYQPVEFLPHFNWMLAFNKGAAFSFLADQEGWQRWFFVVLTIVISSVLLVWLYRLEQGKRLLPIALTLVLGGAIGNLYDRLVYGHVVDFVDWYYGSYHWPAFNIADAAIVCGAVLLFVDSWFAPKPALTDQKDAT